MGILDFSAGGRVNYKLSVDRNPDQVLHATFPQAQREWNPFSSCHTRLITPSICQKNGSPSFIIPVTSNLATVPAPSVPDYCAMKAALHSFSLTLHLNLKQTNIHVMEVIPPSVLPLPRYSIDSRSPPLCQAH